jgi:hypothetical protein
MDLVTPTLEHLPGYVAALERGWSADNLRAQAAAEELGKIHADAEAFLDAITTDPDNLASQRVIAATGGRLVEEFEMPPSYGRATGLRYRIDLAV